MIDSLTDRAVAADHTTGIHSLTILLNIYMDDNATVLKAMNSKVFTLPDLQNIMRSFMIDQGNPENIFQVSLLTYRISQK